jgi:hypothetical protein
VVEGEWNVSEEMSWWLRKFVSGFSFLVRFSLLVGL